MDWGSYTVNPLHACTRTWWHLLTTCITDKGVWHVSADDIECLGIGCGIMGSGGGGNPKIGKNVALDLWNEGKNLKIYHPHVKLVLHYCNMYVEEGMSAQ